MRVFDLLNRLGSFLFLGLLVVVLGGCSIPFISAPITTTSATACPSPVPSQSVRGTIQSINGTTLMITDAQGNSVKATYTNTTRFTRQAKVTTAALQSGTFVFVAVTQNTDNTYTATTISLTNSANRGLRPGGFGAGSGRRGNSACRQGQRGNFGRQDPTAGNGNTRGITGTVSQLSGTRLTVTDVNQADYTVTLNSTTQIIQSTQAAATDLQVGMRINVVGMHSTQGVITARSVTILLPGTANSGR